MSSSLPWQGGHASTLVELLHGRALRQPEQQAYEFLSDDGTRCTSLTYAQLDQQARAIGAALRERDGVGQRALLLYPSGLDFITAFFGCLYAGIVAVPVYPPHPARLARTLPKIKAIVENARPTLALTTTALLSTVADNLENDAELRSMLWIATDAIAPTIADGWSTPPIQGESLAFLQYTSGSTGTPKGVMLTHSNLLHNSSAIAQRFGHTPASRGLIWLPLYHDMGLIGGVLQPLYVGFPVTLMSPVAVLQRPYRWLQELSRGRITTSGGPSFAYDLCVRRVTPEQRATLNLSNWEVAFNGAEPIRNETLDQFVVAFGSCGFRREAFYPCYGLAEATLFVCGGSKFARPVVMPVSGAELERARVVPAAVEDPHARLLVGCGRAAPDHRVAIVDPETHSQGTSEQVGEIWVAGPSVARGYWGQPDETARVFQAFLTQSGEGPFLRTGDLGFLEEGELFVTGRLKDLIIIGGKNHYPQDIEWTVEQSHPAIRPGCCTAFSGDIAGAERLIVAAEVDRQYYARSRRSSSAEEITRAVRRAVAEGHDLHAHAVLLLKPGSIIKTSSGKVRRRACRAAYEAGALQAMAVGG